MNFTFIYTNLVRVIVVVMAALQLFKHNYKIIAPAAITIALTFVPWLLSLINIQLNNLTVILFQTVVFMGAFLGSGCNYYNSYSWWDRSLHFISGILFFGFGISLAGKTSVGLAGTLIFSFALSLALHVIWEVFEFLIDSIFRTDHQHWQKNSSTINHQPDKAIQPPGLVDTMSDNIAGIIGATVACLGWWVYLR